MQLRVIATVQELIQQAASHARETLQRRLASQPIVRLVAATGSSQLGFLEALTSAPDIDWARVELFHLDEYLGLGQDHPASFSRFVRDRIIEPTGISRYHLIDGTGDPAAVIADVSRAIQSAPVDLAFVGIGDNGHLAFNEPPADFETDEPFVVVALDDVSRHQQVGGRWFARVEDVPTRAITMTVPQILKAREIICLAFGSHKAPAVAACFGGAPTAAAPASALATHAHATVYLDTAAAALLPSPVATV